MVALLLAGFSTTKDVETTGFAISLTKVLFGINHYCITIVKDLMRIYVHNWTYSYILKLNFG